MYRLGERAVARRVPYREAHPFFTRRLKRHAEFVAPKRAHVRQTDDLTVDGLSVAPYQFREFGRERPFRFRCVSALRAAAFDAPIPEQHFSTANEIMSGAQRVHNRRPAIAEFRTPV